MAICQPGNKAARSGDRGELITGFVKRFTAE
jgi:hypothetical protein